MMHVQVFQQKSSVNNAHNLDTVSNFKWTWSYTNIQSSEWQWIMDIWYGLASALHCILYCIGTIIQWRKHGIWGLMSQVCNISTVLVPACQVLFLLRTIYGKLKYFLTVIKMQWFVHNLSTSVFMAQLFEVRTLKWKVKNACQIYQSVLKTKDQYFPTPNKVMNSN